MSARPSSETIARNVAFIDVCRPSTVDMMNGLAAGSYAVKIVSPTGKETVFLCEAMNDSYKRSGLKGLKGLKGADSSTVSPSETPIAKPSVPKSDLPTLDELAQNPPNALEKVLGGWLKESQSAPNTDDKPAVNADKNSLEAPGNTGKLVVVKKTGYSSDTTLMGATSETHEPRMGAQPVTFNDRHALKNCEKDKEWSMYANCECARNSLAPIPPGAAQGDSPFRRALEACPAEKAHIEREFYASCMKTYDHGEETDFVCRCMATDVASKYVVNPIFRSGHLSKLRLDAWHSCLAQRERS